MVGINHGSDAPDNGRKLIRALSPKFKLASNYTKQGNQRDYCNCHLHTRFRQGHELVGNHNHDNRDGNWVENQSTGTEKAMILLSPKLAIAKPIKVKIMA